MAHRSTSAAAVYRAKSWMKARWITPSAASARGAQRVEVLEAAAVHLGPGGGESSGGGVRAGQPHHLVAGTEELGDDR